MTIFSIIMEMIPGEARSRMVEPIEADDIDDAWHKARARWYNSPLEEQHRQEIVGPGGTKMSVTPQIVDIKEGEYMLPDLESAPVSSESEPAPEPQEG
jgi:hypothetical protein